VTPTNLLYNVVACPGADVALLAQGQTGGTLTWLLLAGTLPGVIAGSVIRVYLLLGPVVFDFVVAPVLIPLGVWLAFTKATPATTNWQGTAASPVIVIIAAVAAASAASTASAADRSSPRFWSPTASPRRRSRLPRSARPSSTSLAGVVTFSILSVHQHGSVAPDWPTGIALDRWAWPVDTSAPQMHARMPGNDHPAPAGAGRGGDRHPLLVGRPGRRVVGGTVI